MADENQVVDETTNQQSTGADQTASDSDSQVNGAGNDDTNQQNQGNDLNLDGGSDDDQGGDDGGDDDQNRRELSPRYQRKATKLAERLNQDRQSTQEFYQDLTRPAPRPQPYNPMQIEDGTTYDTEKLIQDREQYGKSKFQEGASIAELRMMQMAEVQQKERYADQLERETYRVEKKFPELDPDTEDYDEGLREEIDSLFADTGYRSRDSYEKFVTRYMKGANTIAEKRAAQTGDTIAQQASRKPTLGNSKSQNTSRLSRAKISQMSDEEYVKRKPEIDKWVAEQSRQ